MRRVDFQLVSQAMNDSKPRSGDTDYHERMIQWEEDCTKLADAFGNQSAAFERPRFLKDCGMNVYAVSHPLPRT